YGEEELLFSTADRAAVGAAVVKQANARAKQLGKRGTMALSEETAEIPGGFIMRSGNIETNCAVDTLVKMHRAALSSQVAEILFS
ncbi:MAG: V-type ATP synthase subunit E, partial [Clostridia bacterium]|nr:V-type ATP synthase subunit E [Clostridia bacterium]